MRFPNLDHETIVCGLTEQPNVDVVLFDAIDQIERDMHRILGHPNNIKLSGILMAPLWRVYLAGERRGVARSHNDATALFPVPEPEALR